MAPAYHPRCYPISRGIGDGDDFARPPMNAIQLEAAGVNPRTTALIRTLLLVVVAQSAGIRTIPPARMDSGFSG